MFKRLSRRIVLFILLSISVITVAIGVYSYSWVRNTVISEYIEMSLNYAHSSNDLMTQYLNYVAETGKMIASNPSVSTAISRPNASSEVTTLLDNLALSMNIDIAGVTLYMEDGNHYSISKLSNVPALENIAEDQRVSHFMDEPESIEMWISRYNLSAYYNQLYSAEGVFSYLLKFSIQGKKGLMVIDLNPRKLFEFYESDNPLFQHQQLFLVRDGENIIRAFQAEQDEAQAPLDLHKINAHKDGWFLAKDQLVIHDTIKSSNTQIVMSSPLQHSTSQLSALRWSIIVLSFLSGVIAIVISGMLKNSIIRPLTSLYSRMKAIK